MKNISSFLIMLLIVLFFSSVDGLGADKKTFCNNYADIAVGQYTLGKENHLPGIIPPSWSDNRSGHYSWCMQVPESFANSETAKRRAYLDQYLPTILSAKKVPEGQKVGSAVKNGASGVAATPISIPRPIKVKTAVADMSKAGYISLRDIEKAALMSADKNKVQVKLHYRVEPAIADNLYAGAFLYDAGMKAINVGYTPTRPQNSPEGDFDITLVLPEEPFHAATIEVFLIRSGKVIVKKYFKCPFIWDGNKGKISRPIAKSSNVTNNQNTVPSAATLSAGWGKQWVPVGYGLPVGLDPGRGP